MEEGSRLDAENVETWQQWNLLKIGVTLPIQNIQLMEEILHR